MNYTEAKKKSIYKWREANREAYLSIQKEYMDKHKDRLKELWKENYKNKADEKRDPSLKRYYFKKAWLELLHMEL
jgi:hypothetical protein